MARAMTHPVAYPMTQSKFCNFTKYEEKNNFLRIKGSNALDSMDSHHFFFYQTCPERILGLMIN